MLRFAGMATTLPSAESARILIDFDGVFTKQEGYILPAIIDSLKELTGAEVSRETAEAIYAFARKRTTESLAALNALLAEIGTGTDIASWWPLAEEKAVEHTREALPVELRALLSQFKDRICVITQGNRSRVAKQLNKLLPDVFDDKFLAESVHCFDENPQADGEILTKSKPAFWSFVFDKFAVERAYLLDDELDNLVAALAAEGEKIVRAYWIKTITQNTVVPEKISARDDMHAALMDISTQ